MDVVTCPHFIGIAGITPPLKSQHAPPMLAIGGPPKEITGCETHVRLSL